MKTFKHAALTLSVAGALAIVAGSAYAAFDIPTGGKPSPLGGAVAFKKKLIMFEEFGSQPLPVNAAPHSLPDPGGCRGPKDPEEYGMQLDRFLREPLYPAPTRMSNADSPNPWAARISECLGRPVKGVAEGRAPGEDFAHQRWSEFYPEVYVQTAAAGVRPNSGLRDNMQLHHYSMGEFGRGGLYYNTMGAPGFDGTSKGVESRFNPDGPAQDQLHVWGPDGTLPPKLLMARYGSPILFREYNALPIDESANGGFGKHTISTHEHNGHQGGESDGFAGAYFFPGEYFDYHWPMVLAGHDTINTDATDPRAGAPLCADPRPGFCGSPGAIRKIPGDWRETMSTHWFHDHMVDFTSQNVYKGNNAMMNFYSSVDRGREPANMAEAQGSAATPGYGCHYANPDNVNLCLPSGSALDWGNRDYDVNLVLTDKALDAEGNLWFNTFNTDGFLGDVATVNLSYKPYLDVRARKYRFRILSSSVSRFWKIALVDQNDRQVPFYMVANDGNIMEHAVPFPNVESPEGLPPLGVAERYDIVVDFSKFAPGDKLYFVNLLEHTDGKGPKREVPLSEVLSGVYAQGGCPATCDPVVGKFMEFRVQAMQPGQVDLSMNPADYVEGKKTMIPLHRFTHEEMVNAKERSFSFNRGGDVQPWTIATDGGASFNATSAHGVFNRISAAPDRDSAEIWHIRNGGQGWTHPVHVHFEEGHILKRNGKAPPMWERGARKDIYRIGPLEGDSIDMAIRVREFMGTYMEHCHNTTHEDNAMLLRWDSEHPGQTVAIRTPFPSWDGVSFVDSNTTDVPTYRTGMPTNFMRDFDDEAQNSRFTTPRNTALTIKVPGKRVATAKVFIPSTGKPDKGGMVAVNEDGSILYTPKPGFIGTETFKYAIRNGKGKPAAEKMASVRVNVK